MDHTNATKFHLIGDGSRLAVKHATFIFMVTTARRKKKKKKKQNKCFQNLPKYDHLWGSKAF